ncbi:sensor histidine kinase [Nonomuraea sp. NPDC004297]
MATRPETARKILVYWMDGSMALLFVMCTIAVVVAGVEGVIPAARVAVVVALLAAFFGLAPFVMRDAYEQVRRPTPKLLILGLLAAALTVIIPVDNAVRSLWVDVGAVWVALASLYLRLWTTAWLSAAVVPLVTFYVALMTDLSWPVLLLTESVNTVLLVLTMRIWRWLWWVIRDAHRSRAARARLAVAEERVRFARDLHDLLGRSLSVITLKSELAAKLATKDPDRAAAEMTAVRGLAGESLFEVQQAVHGYQLLDLDEELDRVRAELAATGVSCQIEASTDGLSQAARTLLAWAVREGGTNILKHSTATRCAIRIDGGVLEMLNDGVTGRPGTPGSGLRGLSERLATAGGSFSAGPAPGGEFLLRAVVPA